jgi:uncharacterized lipoprotein YmbA
MMKRFKKTFCILTIVAIFGGCLGSRPSRYYLLSSSSSSVKHNEKKHLKIGINTIKFPDYLQRSPIVTNLNPNQLNIAEFDRWAEPLSDNFSRILAENLVKLIPTDNVMVFPWAEMNGFDFRITMEVRQFQLYAPSPVILEAYWQITGKDHRHSIENRRSEIRTEVKAPDYDTIVSAMSESVEVLSKEIADSINVLNGKP